MIPYQPILSYNLLGIKIDPETIPMILAFAVFIFYAYSHLKKENIDKNILKPNKFGKFILITLFSALVGGRIWYYLISVKWQGWSNIFQFFNITDLGGLTSIGMIIGGVLGILIYIFLMTKIKKYYRSIEFAKLVDLLIPGAALAFFIYRLFGCSIYGDVVGTPTNVFWALVWPDGIVRHPTSFYMALSALFIFLILRLFFSYDKHSKTKFGKRLDGEVALWFLVFYCSTALIIEFFRYGQLSDNLSNLQFILLFFIIVGVINLIFEYKNLKRKM